MIGRYVSVYEFAVLRAIEELGEHYDTFTQDQIADYIGCHRNRVSEAFKRLKKAGEAKRVGSPRNGYKYIRIDKDNSRAAEL